MTRDEVEEKIKNAENAIIEISKDLPFMFYDELSNLLEKWIKPRDKNISQKIYDLVREELQRNGINERDWIQSMYYQFKCFYQKNIQEEQDK